MNSLLRVNLYNTILYRILDFGQHIVAVAMDNLNKFAYLPS